MKGQIDIRLICPFSVRIRVKMLDIRHQISDFRHQTKAETKVYTEIKYIIY